MVAATHWCFVIVDSGVLPRPSALVVRLRLRCFRRPGWRRAALHSVDGSTCGRRSARSCAVPRVLPRGLRSPKLCTRTRMRQTRTVDREIVLLETTREYAKAFVCSRNRRAPI